MTKDNKRSKRLQLCIMLLLYYVTIILILYYVAKLRLETLLPECTNISSHNSYIISVVYQMLNMYPKIHSYIHEWSRIYVYHLHPEVSDMYFIVTRLENSTIIILSHANSFSGNENLAKRSQILPFVFVWESCAPIRRVKI